MEVQILDWMVSHKGSISFAISLIGFGLSIYNFIKDKLDNRVMLQCTCLAQQVFPKECQFDVILSNCSESSISITGISLFLAGAKYPITLFPVTIRENIKQNGHIEVSRTVFKSSVPPINLSPKQSSRHTLVFRSGKENPFPPDELKKPFVIEMNTNKKTISFIDIWSDDTLSDHLSEQ